MIKIRHKYEGEDLEYGHKVVIGLLRKRYPPKLSGIYILYRTDNYEIRPHYDVSKGRTDAKPCQQYLLFSVVKILDDWRRLKFISFDYWRPI